MARFEPLPIPRFDRSLLAYLERSFLRIKTAIQELDANVSQKPVAAEILANETLVSGLSYRDLTTPGPIVTIRTGDTVVVWLHAQIMVGVATDARMGFTVSGATTLGVDDKNLLYRDIAGNTQHSACCMLTNLTPGENTFTAKYWANPNSVIFERRRMVVMPIKG